MQSLLLQDKTALVTGASRGIGQAIARKLAQHGANVAFTYLSSSAKAEALSQELAQETGRKVQAFQSDAANFASCEKLIADVTEAFGPIDILVNNAGITRDNLLLRMTEAQWDEVIDTNLKSIFNLSKHAAKGMLRNKDGASIINITSIVGIQGNAGQANYSAAKAGIIGFTKSLARELGSRQVRCNAVAPGFIATEMTGELDEKTKESWAQNIPLKRAGTPEEVADLCLFLASPLSRYITGQVIAVDGGLAM